MQLGQNSWGSKVSAQWSVPGSRINQSDASSPLLCQALVGLISRMGGPDVNGRILGGRRRTTRSRICPPVAISVLDVSARTSSESTARVQLTIC